MIPPAEPHSRCVAVSAPGKVLFAGGYLVLDRQFRGLVFGLNARIHVLLREWSRKDPPRTGGTYFLVQSPQFEDANWLYAWNGRGESSSSGEGSQSIVQVTDDDDYTKSPNKFVATTLLYTLTYLSRIHALTGEAGNYILTILADDDYYSHNQPRQLNHFTHFATSIPNAHKTGLGSSAALVTALTTSLLRYFSASAPPSPKVAHNLAQAAHCAAQGKVGSGFDVAAAVYGSCLYTRFSPAILEWVGDSSAPDFAARLHTCVEDLETTQKWDVQISHNAVRIPQGLRLVMCDVDCGSETPGMVRQLLAWRKEQPSEADLLWAALQQGTEELCQRLTRLAELEGIETTGQAGYLELADIIQTIRSLVREMSTKSAVPVEPPVITELLDYCTALPGVVGGVAPGAGGYDAVALLVRNDDAAVSNLQERLGAWKSTADTEGARIGNVRLLSVRQDAEGLRVEDPSMERYGPWK